MALDPLPDLTVAPSQGYSPTDPSPIRMLKWRHLTTESYFVGVEDVLDYHERGTLQIDLKVNPLSVLDLTFEKDANLTNVGLSLRFIRDSDGKLVETPIVVGKGGASLGIASHPTDATARVLNGIAVANEDQFDGTPIYDFNNMGKEGIYEIVVKMENQDGNILYLRIPFQIDNFEGSTETQPPTEEEGESGGEREQYDEYYVTIVEGSSPFTKRSSTHYRSAAIAMLKDPYCFERIILGEECGLTVSGNPLTADVSSPITLTLNHGINEEFNYQVNVKVPQEVTQTGEYEFTSETAGAYVIEFEVNYEGLYTCSTSITIEFTEPPTPPTPIPRCGEENTGGSGQDTREMPMTKPGTVYIYFDLYGAKDSVNIYGLNGTPIFNMENETYKHYISFNFNPAVHGNGLKIAMNEQGGGSGWEYVVYCPCDEVPIEVKTNAGHVGGGAPIPCPQDTTEQ